MYRPTIVTHEVTVRALCCVFDLHQDGFPTLVVQNIMTVDCSVSQHAHTADKNPGVRGIAIKRTAPLSIFGQEILRKMWLSEGRDQCADVDGDDGDDDTGQEDGGQFVYIFNAHKDQ